MSVNLHSIAAVGKFLNTTNHGKTGTLKLGMCEGRQVEAHITVSNDGKTAKSSIKYGNGTMASAAAKKEFSEKIKTLHDNIQKFNKESAKKVNAKRINQSSQGAKTASSQRAFEQKWAQVGGTYHSGHKTLSFRSLNEKATKKLLTSLTKQKGEKVSDLTIGTGKNSLQFHFGKLEGRLNFTNEANAISLVNSSGQALLLRKKADGKYEIRFAGPMGGPCTVAKLKSSSADLAKVLQYANRKEISIPNLKFIIASKRILEEQESKSSDSRGAEFTTDYESFSLGRPVAQAKSSSKTPLLSALENGSSTTHVGSAPASRLGLTDGASLKDDSSQDVSGKSFFDTLRELLQKSGGVDAIVERILAENSASSTSPVVESDDEDTKDDLTGDLTGSSLSHGLVDLGQVSAQIFEGGIDMLSTTMNAASGLFNSMTSSSSPIHVDSSTTFGDKFDDLLARMEEGELSDGNPDSKLPADESKVSANESEDILQDIDLELGEHSTSTSSVQEDQSDFLSGFLSGAFTFLDNTARYFVDGDEPSEKKDTRGLAPTSQEMDREPLSNGFTEDFFV